MPLMFFMINYYILIRCDKKITSPENVGFLVIFKLISIQVRLYELQFCPIHAICER